MNLLTRVLIAPAATIVLMLILGAGGYFAMNTQQQALVELFDVRFSHTSVATSISDDVLSANSRAYRILTWSESRGEKYVEAESKSLLLDFDKNATEFAAWAASTNLSDEEKSLGATMVSQISAYRKALAGALDMATVDINAAIMTMQTADDNFGLLSESAEKLVVLEKRLGKSDVDKSASTFQSMRATGLLMLLVSVSVAGFLSFAMTRSVLRQIGGEPAYASEITSRIANSDLSSVIRLADKDSSSLLANMKSMQEQLTSVVMGIKGSAEAIGSGTKQIAMGNADLSQRTEEQASSLEETATSIEKLTSTVKQNADNAEHANQLALGASQVAVKGGEVVGQVVDTMSSINESSKKIVDIISVIDGIAFQTNILALNAAVEAARAGEQGRGFAVVATEVRNLAQRSATAAKEIKSLIGDSVDKVGAGTKLVDEAGKTMGEIVSSIKRVTDIMSEITAASQEQSAGIEQVNQAITQMDEVTQQNAALVEEAAAAAESLEEQARNLETEVAVFKISAAATGRAAHGAEVAHLNERPAAKPASERRGQSRAPNGARMSAKPATAPALRAKVAAAGGGEEAQWEEF